LPWVIANLMIAPEVLSIHNSTRETSYEPVPPAAPGESGKAGLFPDPRTLRYIRPKAERKFLEDSRHRTQVLGHFLVFGEGILLRAGVAGVINPGGLTVQGDLHRLRRQIEKMNPVGALETSRFRKRGEDPWPAKKSRLCENPATSVWIFCCCPSIIRISSWTSRPEGIPRPGHKHNG